MSVQQKPAGEKKAEPPVKPQVQSVAQPMSQTKTQPQQAKSSVLLIEDDPLLTKMYKTKFSSDGMDVMTAMDGETGLKMALENKPALIILDIMLPKLSGLDLLGKLRQDPRGKTVPVLVLTNMTQRKEAEIAMELGAKEFLVKANYTPAQIAEKVKSYVSPS